MKSQTWQNHFQTAIGRFESFNPIMSCDWRNGQALFVVVQAI